jgi:hypothetical protein
MLAQERSRIRQGLRRLSPGLAHESLPAGRHIPNLRGCKTGKYRAITPPSQYTLAGKQRSVKFHDERSHRDVRLLLLAPRDGRGGDAQVTAFALVASPYSAAPAITAVTWLRFLSSALRSRSLNRRVGPLPARPASSGVSGRTAGLEMENSIPSPTVKS